MDKTSSPVVFAKSIMKYTMGPNFENESAVCCIMNGEPHFHRGFVFANTW